jgi:hypothetical protein
MKTDTILLALLCSPVVLSLIGIIVIESYVKVKRAVLFVVICCAIVIKRLIIKGKTIIQIVPNDNKSYDRTDTGSYSQV